MTARGDAGDEPLAHLDVLRVLLGLVAVMGVDERERGQLPRLRSARKSVVVTNFACRSAVSAVPGTMSGLGRST
jgi:hypothetical protein